MSYRNDQHHDNDGGYAQQNYNADGSSSGGAGGGAYAGGSYYDHSQYYAQQQQQQGYGGYDQQYNDPYYNNNYTAQQQQQYAYPAGHQPVDPYNYHHPAAAAASYKPASAPQDAYPTPDYGNSDYSHQQQQPRSSPPKEDSPMDTAAAAAPRGVTRSNTKTSVRSPRPGAEPTRDRSDTKNTLPSVPVDEKEPIVKADDEDDAKLFASTKKTYKWYEFHWTWTMGKIICLSVTAAVLVILAILAYLFYPRFPTIYINNIVAASLSKAYEFLPDNPDIQPPNLNAFNFKLHLLMNVTAYNSNLYHMKMDKIDVTATMHVNQSSVNVLNNIPQNILDMVDYIGPFVYPGNTLDGYKQCTPNYDVVIGEGQIEDIFFPAKSNYTFTMNFTISYHPDPCLGLMRDPAFQELMQVCNITQQRTLRSALVEYKSVSTVKLLQPLGYNPVLDSHVRIRCPADSQQIATITSLAQGDKTLTSVDLLQKVFNDHIVLQGDGSSV